MPDESPEFAVLAPVASEDSGESIAASERWGWLEFFTLVQVLWGVCLFLPGSQAFRTYIRAFPYVASLVAVVACVRATGADALVPGARWLVGVGALLGVNLLHESTQMAAGLAQVVFQASIAAPAFWAGKMGHGELRLRRVLWLLLIGSLASAGLGVLQVYFPDRFLPPQFSALALSLNPEFVNALSYVGPNGDLIVRPPGLSDLPGGASIAGMTAAILGLAFAFQGGRRFLMHAFCLGSAVVGLTAVYLTQVRSIFLMTMVAMFAFGGIRLRQGRLVQGTWIALVVAAVGLGSFLWATMLGGETVFERFSSIFDTGVVQTYQENRGLFLTYTFGELVYQFPLGAGLGRWGMMQVYFGDPLVWEYQPIHAEIQPTGWLLDGGVLMWVFYGGALLAALRYSYRVTVHDGGELSDLATMVLCIQVVIVGLCFTGPVFNTQLGIEFWLLSAVLYGAGRSASSPEAASDE
jgi:hypothetical protein